MDTYINFDDVKLKKYIEPESFDWILGLCKRADIEPQYSRIIDLGSGHGQNTLSFAHHFQKAYGIEVSDHMLKYAKKLKKRGEQWYDFSNARFYKGNFTNIPIKQVEVIALFNSIHYSNNVIQDLSNILSNICINGLLIISEPHINSLAVTSGNRDVVKRKHDQLKNTRHEIKKFLKINKNNVTTIREFENNNKYFIALKKINKS